ncbi:SMC-Scp complex subunit ScpB [Allostreptomyces psammosilenae]|uniref:Segregation and condensation protein B n=1 Tax=Allostreptomyces psammosilenae TaxID=1892865 RepID=A0A852ZPI9_9ACTN|nr:SMC-Scp complex subunit ScpB [Allostreptomyces psammosilenae]NYI03397.1 segregation and condensation protein B [Allostreptomyces psammosilenae]
MPNAAVPTPHPNPTDIGMPEIEEPEIEEPENAATDHAGAAAAPPGPRSPAEAVAALELAPALEAVLMVADQPVTEAHLASILDRPRDEVAETLRRLAEEYREQGRGFDLRLVAGGWRFYTRAEYAAAVERFVLDGQQARLTQAALETLAVVAYRQPVSRGRVSAVRGVNCDGVMRTLLQRGLVEEAGTDPATGAILYRTTNYFLERMGLRGLEELPELAPFLPEVDDVEAESAEGSVLAAVADLGVPAQAGGGAPDDAGARDGGQPSTGGGSVRPGPPGSPPHDHMTTSTEFDA